MNYTVEKLEKSQIKFNFTVDKAAYEQAVLGVYNKTKHKYAIPGFRKGHAPKKVIEGMYGPGVFFSDTVNDLIDMAIDELEKTGEYDFVAFDSVDGVDVPDEGGVKFALLMTVKPEVKLGQYKDLAIQKKVEKVTAKNIDEYIANQLEKQARLVDVDRPAEMGDTVNIDFSGAIDGEKFEGGSGENFDLQLGSGTFIPGFEEQLVGVNKDDVRDVKVTFPTDYGAEHLAGKEAVFTCTVHSVKYKELPKLDDEFVKEISENLNTVDEYKASVKEQLTKEAEERAERDLEDKIVEKVVENAEIDIPEAMIKQEAEDMVKDFEYRLQYQGLKLDDYLKYSNLTRDKLADDYKEQAEKTLKVRLVMEAIVKAENLQIEDKEIDAKIEQLAEEGAQTVDEFRKTIRREQMNYIVNSILSEKLMTLLKESNKAAKKPTAKKSDVTSADGEEKPQAAPKKAAAKKAEKKETAE